MTRVSILRQRSSMIMEEVANLIGVLLRLFHVEHCVMSRTVWATE